MPLAIDILENIGQGTGGMDLDSDFLRVSRGDYVGALNIRRVSNAGQTAYAYENILGNELAWFMPTLVRQNKIFKIYLTAQPTNTQISYRVNDANGLVTTVSFTIPANDIAGTLSAAVAWFGSQLTAAIQTYAITSTQTSSTAGFVTLEITTILGKDWFLIPNTGNPANTDVVILQEAVDTSIAGDLKVIGGRELVGDLFIYSTTQNNLPSQLEIFFVSGTAGNPYIIETVLPHGLTGGEEITINGLTIATNANGTWMVLNIISPTQFTISQNWTVSDGARGTLTLNTHGIGEIGVSEYDANTGTSTYTTLLRSRKLNFNTLKQIDCYHEKNNILFSLYWTDDYNVPRVLYYKGAFITNGAITEFNPLGRYRYDTLEEETRLFLKNTEIRLTFSQQYQTGGGGGVLSGNHRYAIRFITESGATTECTVLTNPINVYTADVTGNAHSIIGNAPTVNTNKINELLITGILPGLFKFVELIDLNYVGASFTASLVRRDLLTQDPTQTIQHNGTEILEPFDTGELIFENTVYSTAKNIDGIESTLILSNLTTPSDADFSEWAHQIKYLLQRTTLQTVGDALTVIAGEYQLPVNVNTKAGYMHNETYRFGVEVQYKDSGLWSSAYHVVDITFDKAPASGQRLQGLDTFVLTNNGFNIPVAFISYVQFTNVDPDFILPDGRRVRDVISAVRFVRAECIPEVLACGMVHLGVKTRTGLTSLTNIYSFPGYVGSVIPATNIYPNFTIAKVTPPPPNTAPAVRVAFRKFGAFYSPDVLMGNTAIQGFASDVGVKLKIIGQPLKGNATGYWTSSTTPQELKNEFTDYRGMYNNSNPLDATYVDFNLDNLQTVSRAGSVTMAGETYTLNPRVPITDTPAASVLQWQDQRAIVLHSPADIVGTFQGVDGAHYYAQIFKAIINKYGDVRNTKYVGTGHIAEITVASDPSDIHDVFGGDTFTQKTYIRHRYFEIDGGLGPSGGAAQGYNAGYGFYSQNRVNSQMRDGTASVYPVSEAFTSLPNRIANWLQSTNDESFSYNQGYNVRNQVQVDPAFDITAEQQTDLPTRAIYSDVKAQNSLVDNYRNFPPFNFKDADNNFGEIMHHANVNGKLMVWQIDAFSDMMFNPRAVLSTAEGSEVITGTGAKMSQPQDVLSTYGTLNKWSVKLWLSAGGKDVAGWITNTKSIARFGYDGTVIISDREHMKSFLANNLTWAQLYDTPAHGEGIHATYDARFHDVIWVMRGRKDVQVWSSAFGYIIGAEVFVAGGSTFERTGDIYISLINNNQNNNPLTSPAAWQRVSHSDGRYWNEYTLVWNELTNKFQSFYTFKPKIMLEWLNSFISPSPRTEKNIYLHNRLKYCSWYQDGVSVQEEDGYIDMLLNKDPELVKHFLASMFNSELPPFRVECTTKQHKTFMVAADFESEVDVFFAAIKNDILTSSNGQNNNEDTGNIFGNYVIVRLYFEKLVYQKIVSAVIKFIPTHRSYKT